MNCSQARELLSCYRELKNDHRDTTELDVHLSQCAACRRLLEQYSSVGKHIRALPPIAPSTQAHSRLMQALAAEHARYLQRVSPDEARQTPNFLRPYLKAHGYRGNDTDALTAFSSAETGPLPMLPGRHKNRRLYNMNHVAIIGVAAAVLMVVMMGGLTSLLLLAKNTQSITASGKGNLSITQQSQVAQVRYATSTSYQHIDSAVANRDAIYYTAHNDQGWMLERLDNQTHASTPLLALASNDPLIVLGSSPNWLLWLQFDLPKTVTIKKSAHHAITELVRTWTLYASPQHFDQATYRPGAIMPVVLQQGSFQQNTVPNWVTSPIQGAWFTQQGLLVAQVDNKGNASLLEYQLPWIGTRIASTTLATASNGHILTSPTATSDGTTLYWGEEWLGNDNVLRGDIWTQQTTQAAPNAGKWVPHTTTNKYLFHSDETSFRPQIVDNTLFLLNTNILTSNNANATATATSAPATSATSATSTPATQATGSVTIPNTGNAATITPRVDAATSITQPDTMIRGTLLAYSVNGDMQLQLPLGTDGPVSSLQGGGRFVIWQNSDNSFNMFDVVAKSPVSLDPNMTSNNIDFLAVNGDTAVWMVNGTANNTIATPQPDANPAPITVMFNTFNWPYKATATK